MQSLRKMLFVLAVLSLLVATASAQTVMNCLFSVENPRTIRPEGITEIVGDARLDCAGWGSAVTVDIRVQYIGTTNVSSREMPNGKLEAVLLVSSYGMPAPAASTVVLGTNGVQGILGPGPTSVTFAGIQFDPGVLSAPGTNVATYRVRNVRVAAPSAGGQVSGFVSIVQTPGSTGSVSPSVTPPVPLSVASVAGEGLLADITDGTSPLQCNDLNKDQAKDSTDSSPTMSRSFRARFREPTGFTEYLKTHPQEHGVVGWTDSALIDAGEANHGTRLRVQVTDVPAGVKVFVSRTAGVATLLLPNLVDARCANVLSDPNIGPQYAVATNNGGLSGEATVELPVSGGVATACYEVASDSGTVRDDIRPNVYLAYLANVPAKGAKVSAAATVAPISTSSSPGGFSRPIPRFRDIGVSEVGLTVTSCQTVLLFPFVTSVAGFDTGLAISNTSADSPVDAGVSPNDGACTLHFFGATPVPPQGPVAIAAGSHATWLLSNVAPNFTGYIYADCEFIGAHGYAFITDLGANKFAQGYLALVVHLDEGELAFDQ